MKRFARTIAALGCAFACAASAQTYPTKSITLAVPFSVGSSGTNTHQESELLKAATGIDMLHAPFKGSGFPSLVITFWVNFAAPAAKAD